MYEILRTIYGWAGARRLSTCSTEIGQKSEPAIGVGIVGLQYSDRRRRAGKSERACQGAGNSCDKL